MDLQRARTDLGYFAELIGQPLRPWQAAAFALTTLITCIVAPRQSGKSRSLAVLALWWAFKNPGSHVLEVSAGEDASRRLLADMRQMAVNSPLLAGSLVEEFTQLLKFSNGSTIRSVPASERAVRGWRIDLLIGDEATQIPDDLLLGAAFPTTAARPNARIVLGSSATVADGAFYDNVIRGEAGDEHVRTFRWALQDADWISPSMVAAMRASMSELRFKAEMEGQFASSADSLFTRQALEAVTADYRPATLATLTGPARVLGGVDWGAVNDRSACVAIGRVPIGAERVFAVVMANRWLAGAPLNGVINEIAASPAHWAGLAIEANGLGLPCSQDLSRAIRERPDEEGGKSPRRYRLIQEDLSSLYPRTKPQRSAWDKPCVTFSTKLASIHVTADSKAATYSALRLLVDRQQLLLPAGATDLLRELLLLRVDLSPGGAERIEASSGHDDLADALSLALMPYRDDSKNWRTALGNLADPRLTKLPAIAPPDVRTVRTGGGIEVPAVPAFQSVAGPELTVPPGVHRGPAPMRLGDRFVIDTTQGGR